MLDTSLPPQKALERGNISSLTWEEKFGLHPAEDTEEEKPQVVELPARVYSMLSVLILIGVMLVVLMFLRH